jgi:hypothetical protein
MLRQGIQSAFSGGTETRNSFYAALTLAGGLAGGILSHYIWLQSAHAQSQAPAEIRAQSFTLVDPNNNVLGRLFIDRTGAGPGAPGSGAIRLFDQNGRELWRAGVQPKIY